MSKYTTEVRFICETESGLTTSKGYNDTNTIITNAIPKIFNFDFPIFDESYRTVLEKKILKHFYTREIGEETVGLWKLRLDTRLNEIMPYYNQLYKSELLEFNPLYTVNLNRTRKTNFDSEKNENESVKDDTSSSRTTGSDGSVSRTTGSNGKVDSSSSGTSIGSGSGTSSNTNTDLYSDTPQGSLTGVENKTYLTNARKVTDSGQTSSNTNNTNSSSGSVVSTESGTDSSTSTESSTDNSTGSLSRTRGNKDTLESTENYLESVNGYDGKDASELLIKYRESFLNIDVMLINDLEDLFFQLW